MYLCFRYFIFGLFVRGKKLDLGINCFDVVVDRYGKIDDFNVGVIIEEFFVVGSN